jgi:hypothetical protein
VEYIYEERLNKMDTTELETDPEKTDAAAEQQDVPKEEVAVGTIGAYRRPIWGPPSSRRAQPKQKKRTQAMVGPETSGPLPADR